MEEDKKDYDENKNDLIKSLEYETIVYVGYRLELKGFDLSEYFKDQYPSSNIDKKYLHINVSQIKFNLKNQKDKFLKIILSELDKIINKVVDLNLIQNLSIEEVLEIIGKKGPDLNFYLDVPKKYHANKQIIISAINNDCYPCDEFSYHMDSKEILNLLFEKDKFYKIDFNELSDVLKDDYDIALKAITKNASNINCFSERLKNNHELIKIALQKDASIFDNFNEEFKKDREIVKIALKQNGYVFIFVSKYFENDKEMFLLAIQNLRILYSNMVYNDEYMGMLFYASDTLKDNEEVVLEAVKYDYDSVKFISARLKNDVDFIINMIVEKVKFDIKNEEEYDLDSFYYTVFKNLDSSLKSKKELFLKIVKIDTSILNFATSKIKGDIDIAIEALKNDIDSISYFTPVIKSNKKIIELLQNKNYKNNNIDPI